MSQKHNSGFFISVCDAWILCVNCSSDWWVMCNVLVSFAGRWWLCTSSWLYCSYLVFAGHWWLCTSSWLYCSYLVFAGHWWLCTSSWLYCSYLVFAGHWWLCTSSWLYCSYLVFAGHWWLCPSSWLYCSYLVFVGHWWLCPSSWLYCSSSLPHSISWMKWMLPWISLTPRTLGTCCVRTSDAHRWESLFHWHMILIVYFQSELMNS